MRAALRLVLLNVIHVCISGLAQLRRVMATGAEALSGSDGGGEMLYNGIQLPVVWPPRIALTNHTSVAEPWYVAAAPPRVFVDVGRQLFVDGGFLADRRLSTATVHHHAPSLAQAAPGTIFGGGGVWWDAELGHFKNFFTCELVHIAGDGALGPLCLSTSTDGEHWENMSGGRPVWNMTAYSRAVLLDESSEERWKMAAVEDGTYNTTTKAGNLAFQLYTSPDGIKWSRASAKSNGHAGVGTPGDCSSAIFNPFRKTWVLSSKMYNPLLGRSRRFIESTSWTEESLGAASDVPWSAADVLDPRYLGVHEWSKPCSQCRTMPQCLHGAARCSNSLGTAPEEYNLDALAYESVMVGMFRIFRCKAGYKGCGMMTYPNGSIISHELADILLGFSRDGFTFSRTPVAQPLNAFGYRLAADRRYPFVGQDLGAVNSWNRHGVGSVVGGLTIAGPDRQHETLRMFFTSASAGVATLRRDGFASIGSNSTQPSRVVTTVLVFHSNKTHLFLNMQGGLRGLRILDGSADVADVDVLPCLLTMAGQLDNDTDSTMLHVQMQPGVLPGVASLQGRPFRIFFDLGANARLYSFWFSSSAAGHSGGWLGAGGPRYARGLQDL